MVDEKKRSPELDEELEGDEDLELDGLDDPLAKGRVKEVKDPDQEVADFIKQTRPKDDVALAALLGGAGLANLIDAAKAKEKPAPDQVLAEKKEAPKEAAAEAKQDVQAAGQVLPQDPLSLLDRQFKASVDESKARLEQLKPDELRQDAAKPLVERQWQQHLVELLNQMPDRYEQMQVAEGAVDPAKVKEKVQAGKLEELTKAELIAAVKLEAGEGKFGPASELAYKRSMNWFNELSLNVYKDTIASGLRMRAGGPISAFTFDKADKTDFATTPEAFKAKLLSDSFKVPDLKAMVEKGNLSTQLIFDASGKPGADQLIKFENSKNWIDFERNRLAENTNQIEANRRYQVISEFLGIKDEGWKPPEDPRQLVAYCQRADQVCNLMFRVRNYAEAIKSLDSIDGDFKLKALDEKEFPGRLVWDEKAKRITKMELDLPDSLNFSRENEQKLQKLQQWLDKYGPRVEQALGDYMKGAPVRYGDFIESGKVRTGANGETLAIQDKGGQTHVLVVDGKLVTRNLDGVLRDPATGKKVEVPAELAGKAVKEFDYICDKFSLGRDERTGEILVHIDRSFEKDHVLNYNRWAGTQVGHLTETRRYRPDELVAVQTSSGLPQLIRADRLAEFQAIQALWHHGGKIATCAMDVGMIVSGSVGARAALQAGRMLYVAANVGRAALGLGGLLDPTFRQMGEVGENLRKARHAAILFDVTQGLVRRAPALMGSSKVLFESSAAAEVHKAIEASTTMSRLHSATTKVFAACDAVYLPMMSKDIMDKARVNMGYNPQQMLDDAAQQIGSGREKDRARNPEQIRDASKEMLKTYEQFMGIKDAAQRDAVAKQFENIRAKLGTDEAEAYKTKDLAGFYLPTGAQLRDLKEANSHSIPRFHTTKEKDGSHEEKVAAAIGLLHLSVMDGKLPEDGVLVKRDAEVKGYTYYISGPEGEQIPVEVKPETVKQEVTIKQVMATLQDAALNAENPQTRAVAADALYRMGAMGSGRYASLLLEHIEKDASSAENKESRFKMLSQAASLIDATKISEAFPPSDPEARRFAEAENYGASSEQLLARMREIAASEKDPDLRAFAMAILHTQSHKDADKKLEAYAKEYQELKEKPGAFREKFLNGLKAELQTVIPDEPKKARDEAIEKRLNAAKAFRNFEGSALEAETFKDLKINENLSECLVKMGLRDIKDKPAENRSDLDLALRVIDALMERKDTLDKTQRIQIATTATGIMGIPYPPEGTGRTGPALAKLAVIARMKQIYEDSEPQDRKIADELKPHKNGMLSALKDMIRTDIPGEPIRSGWGQYPEMRIAAITGLKSLGVADKDSVDLIANFLDYDSSQVGPAAFKEKNPMVRAAAAEALYTLAEYRLRYSAKEVEELEKNEKTKNTVSDLGLNGKLYVDELLKREREPAALDVLWRVLERKQRPDPQSIDYHRVFAMESERLDSAREIAITEDKVISFVRQHHKMLDPQYFEGELKRTTEQRRVDPYAGFWGWCESCLDSRATTRKKNEDATENARSVAFAEKDQERRDALTDLTKFGDMNPGEQEMAMKTLAYLVRFPDIKMFQNGDTAYARIRASELLLRLCDGEGNRDVVGNKQLLAKLVVSCLQDSSIDTNPQVKYNLLKCVDSLTIKDPAKAQQAQKEFWLFTPERAAMVYSIALQREKQRFDPTSKDEARDYQSSRALQLLCLQKIYELRGHSAEAMLDAIGHNESVKANLPDVAASARDVLSALRYGVMHLQKDTAPDKGSSLSARADYMEAALNDNKFNHEGSCVALFRGCMDKPIEPPKSKEAGAEDREDPRVPVLLRALNHENERVRMTAAIILADSKVDSHFLRATKVLAELAVNGSKERYQQDAASMLKDIIQRGQPAEQDIAYASWKAAFDARKALPQDKQSRSPAPVEPLAIPDANQIGARKVPVSALDRLLVRGRDPLTQTEKDAIERDRIKNLAVMMRVSEAEVERRLEDPPPPREPLLNRKPVLCYDCHPDPPEPRFDLRSYDDFFRRPAPNLNRDLLLGDKKPNLKDSEEFRRLVEQMLKENPGGPNGGQLPIGRDPIGYSVRREQRLSDLEAQYGIRPFVSESLRRGKPEIGRPVWGQVRHRDSDKLGDDQKAEQNAALAASFLETRLAAVETAAEKIQALKDSCLRTPLSSSSDRRIYKVMDFLKDRDESLRLAAAELILRGPKENFINKGFSDEQRKKAYEVLDAHAAVLIQRGVAGNDNRALNLLDRALESKDSLLTRSALATHIENRAAGWDKGSQLLSKYISEASPFVESLPGGVRRETRKVQQGLVITESKNGELARVVTPDGVKYADLLVKDMAAAATADVSYALARTILESKVDIGKSDEHKAAALKELAKLSVESQVAPAKRLEAASLFLKAGGADLHGREQVAKSLIDLANNSDTKDAARALLTQLDKEASLYVLANLKAAILDAKLPEQERKSKLDLHVLLAEKWKTEPKIEADLYDIYAEALKLNAPELAEKISSYLDRTGDGGHSVIAAKDDPRIAAMAKALAGESSTVRLSAALALSDKQAKEVPEDIAERARIVLHNQIKDDLERMRQRESDANQTKPSDADWAKLDSLMEKIGQGKDDYSRLYIESKRLEMKADHKGLAEVYEKLAAASKERGSETAAQLYKQRATEARQMSDPEIAEQLRQFQAALVELRQRPQAAEAKMEAAFAGLAAKTGTDSPLLANAYFDLAKYYESAKKFEKAEEASLKGTDILNGLARNSVNHMQNQGVGSVGAADPKGTKSLASHNWESSTESVRLKDNGLLQDMLDYQFSRGTVGVDAGLNARRLADRALSANVAVFGQDSMQAGQARENLGDLLLAAGNRNEAEKYYKQALENPSAFGANRGRLTAKLSQAALFKGPEGHQEALQIMEDSLIKMQAEGTDWNTMASQMEQYATLMTQRGDAGKANELRLRASKVRATGVLDPPTNAGIYNGFYPGGGSQGGAPNGPAGGPPIS